MTTLRHILLLLWCLAYMAPAAEVKLAWDANPEPDIAGYEVHYGTEKGAYSSIASVGVVTEASSDT